MLFRFDSNSSDVISDLSIKLKMDNNPESPQELYGYNEKLNICRNNIDNINGENWKKVRWYINEYDFQVKDPIINRAFYKYWEIINDIKDKFPKMIVILMGDHVTALPEESFHPPLNRQHSFLKVFRSF